MGISLTSFSRGLEINGEFSGEALPYNDREYRYQMDHRSTDEIVDDNSRQDFFKRMGTNDSLQLKIQFDWPYRIPESLFKPFSYHKNIDLRLPLYPSELQDEYSVKDEIQPQKTMVSNMFRAAHFCSYIFRICEKERPFHNTRSFEQYRCMPIRMDRFWSTVINHMINIYRYISSCEFLKVFTWMAQRIKKCIGFLRSSWTRLRLFFMQRWFKRRSPSDPINILLLGETGVGKSTFINAFANYLTFDTLQQAQEGEPNVVIPVSFLITTGDNFDEQIVRFTNIDDAENEDFEHPGQSVTQHCRSYTFNLKNTEGKKLQIIDTPGFGDTRGLAQDDYNMNDICQYIKDMSHLDVICFLLKPNESRLNIFFRSCITRLSEITGQNITKNIVFCFTNGRSTFYTPGNTGPLVKEMLNSLPELNVRFEKENVFCFDNESFRYLVARRNHITFTDTDKDDYEISWKRSVTEAQRFIGYVDTNLI